MTPCFILFQVQPVAQVTHSSKFNIKEIFKMGQNNSFPPVLPTNLAHFYKNSKVRTESKFAEMMLVVCSEHR